MKTISQLFAGLLLALFASGVWAELRPFTANSLGEIEAQQRGQPFILGFWSASCTHCPEELRQLTQLSRRYPKLDIVLVATDTPAEAGQLQQLAAEYGVSRHARWVFADPQPERLRFAVDRRWYGELPRTYFYAPNRPREGRSGLIPAAELARWADSVSPAP